MDNPDYVCKLPNYGSDFHIVLQGPDDDEFDIG